MLDMPFFMENESWYKFDFAKKKYVLTDEAPKEAKTSYEEFYKALSAQVKESED